jgi:CubicO group peptidase (beta-lactamase class C family)
MLRETTRKPAARESRRRVNGARHFAAADALVRAGLGTRYTGAVLRVERNGRAVFESAYGTLDASGGAPVDVTTRFDLASLTKLFVATLALTAAGDGALALDEPAARFFPEWRTSAHASITPRHVLAHTAGLASGADYRTLFGEDVERFARERELVAAPGERVIYSDLGFIALGTLVARARGSSLGRAWAVFGQKFGCEATGFLARTGEPAAFPATEFCAWRGRVRGAVHDEKAYLMNGVAGHAGLFGTAHDVSALAEIYLAAVNGRAQNVLPADLARAAVAEAASDPVLRRGLGFALKTSDENSCGALMDRASFGHTGFTGTSVWADPTRDLSVTFLTNAVYFGRGDLRDVRAAVCDACVRATA